MSEEFIDYVAFECSKCGELHISDEKDPRTRVFKVPTTITSHFSNVHGGWYLHCIDEDPCNYESARLQALRAMAGVTKDRQGILRDNLGKEISDIHQWHRDDRQRRSRFSKMSMNK